MLLQMRCTAWPQCVAMQVVTQAIVDLHSSNNTNAPMHAPITPAQRRTDADYLCHAPLRPCFQHRCVEAKKTDEFNALVGVQIAMCDGSPRQWWCMVDGKLKVNDGSNR